LGYSFENGSSHNNGMAKRHHNLLIKMHECNVEKSFLKYCIISSVNSGKSPENIFEHVMFVKEREVVAFVSKK
jgi:hypothetical protein